MTGTRFIDLLIARTWEFDKDFTDLLEATARSESVTTLIVEQSTLDSVVDSLKRRTEWARVLLDRASDEDDRFTAIAKELSGDGSMPPARVINPSHYMHRAADKATMHLELLNSGIDVPYSYIIPPVSLYPDLPIGEHELQILGSPFTVKPANTTGGGHGVITNARTVEDIQKARNLHPNDKYIVQQTIRPAYLGNNRAWFRNFYVFGKVVLCWWDDSTHAFDVVTPLEEERFELSPMREIMKTVARASNLDFFSSEMALTVNELFIIVDYVNEICDMRLQSKHPDGVPDDVVRQICSEIVAFVKRQQSAA